MKMAEKLENDWKYENYWKHLKQMLGNFSKKTLHPLHVKYL